MGRYRRKRNIRRFWEDPLPNLCFVLAILALAAGIFGLFALLGGAGSVPFAVLAFAAGILLILAGKRLKGRRKE